MILDDLHLLRLKEVSLRFLEFQAVRDLLQDTMIKEHLPNAEDVQEFYNLLPGETTLSLPQR